MTFCGPLCVYIFIYIYLHNCSTILNTLIQSVEIHFTLFNKFEFPTKTIHGIFASTVEY